MRKKKLSYRDVEKRLDEIKTKYDDYIVQFMKPLETKRAFEERYYFALRNRLDLTNFVVVENEVIDELVRNEQVKATQSDKPVRKQPTVRRRDYADKVIEANQKRIADRPELNFHPDASFELKKLFGVIIDFERDQWPQFESIVRKAFPVFHSSPKVSLEAKLFALCGTSSEGIPTRLNRYLTCLNSFPRDYQGMDQEEKSCILETAFLFHELIGVARTVKESDGINAIDHDRVEMIEKFVHSILDDFRLKDLKPKKL